MTSPPPAPVLAARGLTLAFARPGGAPVRVLHGIDLALAAGETLALVGESGSGKSAAGLALMRLHDPRAARIGGSVTLRTAAGARELLALAPGPMRALRGREIAMIFQEPMTSLNPVRRIGAQIGEALALHRRLAGDALAAGVRDALREVGIADPARRAGAYPHELSGGMRQRVLIALALAGDPKVLIADEPTTALDVTVQAQVLALLQGIQRARGMAMLFISHSLAVVARVADRVAVMYAGRIVEHAPARALFAGPRHPYTRALLASLPESALARGAARLPAIPGRVVDPRRPAPPGCAFAPRCAVALPACAAAVPALAAIAPGHAARCIRTPAA